MDPLRKPVNGCCPECGSADLVHAQDMTRYTNIKLVDGKWEYGVVNYEGDGQRLFCSECGEYMLIPEGLQ